MRTHVLVISALFLAAPALAQDGRTLEGRTVVLKMDMPGTSDGVEVRPLAGGVDVRKVATSIKANGIGVHNGDAITITKVLVKDHHIEVQLGGGGYGTFADVLAQSAATPVVPYEGKSKYEKDLEWQAKYSPDYRDRQRARDQLAREQHDHYRDNTMAAAVNAQTRTAATVNERAARAQSGSRFNIRYSDGFPEGATSAQGIMNALTQYVDFDGDVRRSAAPTGSTVAGPPAGDAVQGALRKGLTVAQVEQVLGPATGVSTKQEGSMEISVREYTSDGQRVVTQFVGGVMVDYTIKPR